MLRRWIPVLAILTACASGQAQGPVSVFADTVDVGGASLNVDVTRETTEPRKLKITLRMRVNGMEETEKLVADVHIAGFNVDEGSTHWDGFVPPRQPQTFAVLLSVPEGIDTAKATVKLLRSRDSMLLLHEELNFAVSESGEVTPVK